MVAAEIGEGRGGERHALGSDAGRGRGSTLRRRHGSCPSARGPAMLLRKVTMSGVVSPVFTWSSEVVTPSVPIDAERWPAHAPDLAGHLDRRGLAVGAGHRDHRVRVRRVEFARRARRTAAAARDRRDAARARPPPRAGRRPRPRRDRPPAAMKSSPLNSAPLNAPNTLPARDLAMVDGKARHFGIAVDVRDVAQAHDGYSVRLRVRERTAAPSTCPARGSCRAGRRASARSG